MGFQPLRQSRLSKDVSLLVQQSLKNSESQYPGSGMQVGSTAVPEFGGVAAGVQHVPEFHMQPLLAVREYV